jgi:hypothetical protein
MLNPTHRASQIAIAIIALTMTLFTGAIAPIRGENTTKTKENLEPSDRSAESNQIEMFDFLESEDLKFGILDRDLNFNSYSPDTNKQETDFLRATDYSFSEDRKIPEFDRFDK